jgi:FtsH-binding integral membrane protein
MVEATFSRSSELHISGFISRVYAWMAVGLLVTGGVAAFTASSAPLLDVIYGNAVVFWGVLIHEVALVFALSQSAMHLPSVVLLPLFLLYAALNGLTLAGLVLLYTGGSLAVAFLVTAATFGAMSLIGVVTKRDLTGFGNVLLLALIGFIVATVVNLFLASAVLTWLLTYLGIGIFAGLVAADTQKLLRLNADAANTGASVAIRGALAIYLDLINLFLLFLRLFGRRN